MALYRSCPRARARAQPVERASERASDRSSHRQATAHQRTSARAQTINRPIVIGANGDSERREIARETNARERATAYAHRTIQLADALDFQGKHARIRTHARTCPAVSQISASGYIGEEGEIRRAQSKTLSAVAEEGAALMHTGFDFLVLSGQLNDARGELNACRQQHTFTAAAEQRIARAQDE
jgi:hypothetical protein